jgi:UDP-N-acetylglucosamine acyltransferase
MSFPASCRIHPSAILSSEVELAEDVEIGALAVLEGPVRLGAGCVIRPGAYLFGPLTMGPGNIVYTGAVLGERPQHLRYKNEPTDLEIGAHNIFREHVTIHRGTTHTGRTVIGDDNFFMVNSHIAHDCVIGDRCIFTNGSLLAGHCIVDDMAILSGNSAVHQFVRIGRLAMLSGCSAATRDIPPFVIQQGIDTVSAVNVIGMRRNGFSNEQINGVRTAFRVIYREGMTLPAALAKLERDLGRLDVISEMIGFLRGCTRGISPMRSRFRDEAAYTLRGQG